MKIITGEYVVEVLKINTPTRRERMVVHTNEIRVLDVALLSCAFRERSNNRIPLNNIAEARAKRFAPGTTKSRPIRIRIYDMEKRRYFFFIFIRFFSVVISFGIYFYSFRCARSIRTVLFAPETVLARAKAIAVKVLRKIGAVLGRQHESL